MLSASWIVQFSAGWILAFSGLAKATPGGRARSATDFARIGLGHPQSTVLVVIFLELIAGFLSLSVVSQQLLLVPAALLAAFAVVQMWGSRYRPDMACGCHGATIDTRFSPRQSIWLGTLALITSVCALGPALPGGEDTWMAARALALPIAFLSLASAGTVRVLRA